MTTWTIPLIGGTHDGETAEVDSGDCGSPPPYFQTIPVPVDDIRPLVGKRVPGRMPDSTLTLEIYELQAVCRSYSLTKFYYVHPDALEQFNTKMFGR